MEALGFYFEPLLMACPYTFHMSHLLRGYHTVEVGFKIASSLSRCSKFQIKQDKDENKFFRFHAEVSTVYPIWSVFVLETPSRTEVYGHVQYERSPKMCFRCGNWDHTLLSCPTLLLNPSREEENKQEYRLWLFVVGKFHEESKLLLAVKLDESR